MRRTTQKKAACEARRRRKKLSNSSKRYSQKKLERMEVAFKAIIEQEEMKLSKVKLEKSRKLFKRIFPNREIAQSPFAFWRQVVECERKFSVRRADLAYLKALTRAWAVYEHVCCSDLQFFQHLGWLCERYKIPPTSKKFDLLRMILEAVIDYEEVIHGKRRVNRKAISRDAIAIRFLIGKGVRPYNALAYQEKHGGGVDSWSREAGGQGKYERTGEATAVVLSARDASEAEKSKKELLEYIDDEQGESVARDQCAEGYFAETYKVQPGELLLAIYRGSESDRRVTFLDALKVDLKGRPFKQLCAISRLLAPIRSLALPPAS